MFVKILQCLVIQAIVLQTFITSLFVLALVFNDKSHLAGHFLMLGKIFANLGQSFGNEVSILNVIASAKFTEVGSDVLLGYHPSGDR